MVLLGTDLCWTVKLMKRFQTGTRSFFPLIRSMNIALSVLLKHIFIQHVDYPTDEAVSFDFSSQPYFSASRLLQTVLLSLRLLDIEGCFSYWSWGPSELECGAT